MVLGISPDSSGLFGSSVFILYLYVIRSGMNFLLSCSFPGPKVSIAIGKEFFEDK